MHMHTHTCHMHMYMCHPFKHSARLFQPYLCYLQYHHGTAQVRSAPPLPTLAAPLVQSAISFIRL